jgi:hypothetical protein
MLAWNTLSPPGVPNFYWEIVVQQAGIVNDPTIRRGQIARYGLPET